MTNRWMILVLWGMASWPVAALPQEAIPDTTWGLISVESGISGLPVLLDGKRIGHTPLQFFRVAPGTYTLVVKRSPRHSWLYPDWVRKFEIDAGDTLTFRATFNRIFFVRSHPFGARVYLNGRFLGTTPLTFDAGDTVTVRLTLEKEGYSPAVVLWEPSDDNRINVILEPINDFWMDQERARRELKKRRRRQRKLAWISGGVSILAGTAAVLFKKQADRAYADYQKTANPDRMQRYLAEAEKYDRYSNITFGVFQVSFGLGFYFFLKSNYP